MARIGASIEQLDQLKRTFDTQSQNVGSLSSTVTSAVAGTDWEGPAATKFRDAWEREFRPMLQKLQEALTDAGTEVGRRRDAIQAAGS